MVTSVTSARSFIAGTGASTALLGSAIVSFLLVAGILALDELPTGSGSGTESFTIGEDQLGIGTPGALAVAGAPAAIAGSPVVAAATEAPTAVGSVGATTTSPPDDGGPRDGQGPDGPNGPNGPTEPPIAGPGPANPIQQAVAGVDEAVHGATGTNPGLSTLTEPVTGSVDDALKGATGKDLAGHVEGLTGP